MDNIRFVVNENVTEELRALLVQRLEDACITIENLAKEEITRMGGVDSGILRNSMTHEVDTQNLSARVGTMKEYGIYYHEGTGVYAKDGNGRQTPWAYETANGEWHTTRGQEPHPFLENVVNQKRQEIIRALEGNA